MKFINIESTTNVKYIINKNQITFITTNEKEETVISLSCGTVIEVKNSVDSILNS